MNAYGWFLFWQYYISKHTPKALLSWCTIHFWDNLNVLDPPAAIRQIISNDEVSLYHDACEWDCTQSYMIFITYHLSLSQPSLHRLGSDDDVHFHPERYGEDGLPKEDHEKAWGSHSKALQVRCESPKMTFFTLLNTYLSVRYIELIGRSQVWIQWCYNHLWIQETKPCHAV